MRDLAPMLLAAALAAAASASACSVDPTFSNGSGGAGGALDGSSSASTSASGVGGGGGMSTVSSSTTTSSTATSTGSGTPSEVCSNGVDDDDDGLADCADPDCTGAGFSCAPAPPAGWSGPAVLYTGASAPPTCGAGWTQPVAGGLDVAASPATCSACKCGSASNMICDVGAPVVLGQDSQCSGASVFEVFNQCYSTGVIANAYVSAGPVKAVGGKCNPSGGTASVSAATFKTQMAACAAAAAPGGACGAGVCMPPPPAGYGAALCVFQAGNVKCPSVTYTQKTVVYTSINDTRGCSSCSCGTPTGGHCNDYLRVYANATNCSGGYSLHSANGNCYSNAQISSVMLQSPGADSGGSCAPSGGAPVGSATPAQPTTVCCEP